MSAISSGPTPTNIGEERTQPHPSLEVNGGDSDAKAIATVENELVKGGVRPERAAAIAKVVMTQMASFHSGPLPPVRDFAGYEQICKGAARDILDMAVREQAHNHSIEKAEVYGDIILKALGIFAALFVIAGMLFSAIFAALNGHDSLAVAIGSGTGLSLVAGVFVRNYMNKNVKPSSQPARGRTKKKK